MRTLRLQIALLSLFVTSHVSAQVCQSPATVAFVYDTSLMVGATDPKFQELQTWISKFVRNFAIGRDRVQLAAIAYGNIVNNTRHFLPYWTLDNDYTYFTSLVQKDVPSDTVTLSNMGVALAYANEKLLPKVYLHSNVRAPVYVILITNNEPSDGSAAVSYANQLKQRPDFHVLVIAIGPLPGTTISMESVASPNMIVRIQDYTQLEPNSNKLLNLMRCSAPLQPATPPPPPPPPPPPQIPPPPPLPSNGPRCQSGGILSADDNICYVFPNEIRTYDDASLRCASFTGGVLAVVSSPLRKSFVEREIRRLNWQNTWIGARQTFDDWKWVNGQYIGYQGCFNAIAQLPVFVYRSPSTTMGQCIDSCRNFRASHAALSITTVDANPDREIGNCHCKQQNDVFGRLQLKHTCDSVGSVRVYRVDAYRMYQNWGSGQPNNRDSSQHCLAYMIDNKWGDEPCHKGFRSVCQYHQLDQSSCTRQGYRWRANTCLSFKMDRHPWFRSRYICQGEGGDLVSVTSDALANAIQIERTAGEDIWIGGSNTIWKWPNNEEMIFDYFTHDEPDNDNENCAAVETSDQSNVKPAMGWKDHSCSQQFNFACAINPPRTPSVPPPPLPPPSSPTTRPPITPPPATATPPRATPIPTTTAPKPPKPTTSRPQPTPPTTPRIVQTKAPTKPATTTTARPTTKASASTSGTTAQGNETAAGVGHMVGPLSIGIIVAIVVAGIALLLAAIRLIVFCCANKDRHERLTSYSPSSSKLNAPLGGSNTGFDNASSPSSSASTDIGQPPVDQLYASIEQGKNPDAGLIYAY